MSKKVLIVDDAAFMRMMIKNILLDGGFEIAGEAENGRQAIEIFKKIKPDLVTMDITMPELDGIDAVREIMEIDREAKIIICSAMGQEAMVIDAIQAGAKDFVVKPFKPDRVLAAIKKIFSN